MSKPPLFYYITDRTQFPGNERSRREKLLLKIAEAARSGVDYVQLREKDLSTRQIEHLAEDAVRILRQASSPTRLLINSRTDVVLAAGADGVHLRSEDVPPEAARQLLPRSSTLAISCHTIEEVAAAVGHADFVVFGPVFGKKDSLETIPAGLDDLHAACRLSIPVLALGGVTLENTAACLEAGAAGIAAIRLFQENDVSAVVSRLRNSTADPSLRSG